MPNVAGIEACNVALAYLVFESFATSPLVLVIVACYNYAVTTKQPSQSFNRSA